MVDGLDPLSRCGYLPRAMFFHLGDKEILIVLGTFIFVTVGISGLLALSLKRVRKLFRRKGDDR
jgi:hypothetical protein